MSEYSVARFIRQYSKEEEAALLAHCRLNLIYDPDSGRFSYSEYARSTNRRLGKSPECVDRYASLRILGKNFRAHRIAWLMTYGEFPKKQLDHINCIKTDNRIANLREADQSKNQANCRLNSRNTSGFKGVSWYRTEKRWRARIEVNGKCISLGYFIEVEDAHAAYRQAVEKYFGEFGRAA